MSLSDVARHGATRVATETYDEPGYNYRMTDMQAAIGRVQLGRLGEIVAERRRLAARYAELLGGIPGVRIPQEPDWGRSNWQSYCIGLPEGADQRGFMQAMLDRGVATRRAIMSSHLEAPWRTARHGGLSNSEWVSRSHVLLPLFNGMTKADQFRVAEHAGDALRMH